MEKRLYRSKDNVIGGVCAGLGEYFEVDPVFVRVLTVVLALASGFGLLAYVVAWIIVPQRPLDIETPKPEAGYRYSNWHSYVPGMALVALGTILLVREFWFWFSFDELIPVLMVILGIAIIIGGKRHAVSKNAVQAEEMQNGNGGQL
ncbi:MAG: PspC domain-containing protein [candidate division Zixibacteria bacterium]